MRIQEKLVLSSSHPEQPLCHPEQPLCHPEQPLCHPERLVKDPKNWRNKKRDSSLTAQNDTMGLLPNGN